MTGGTSVLGGRPIHVLHDARALARLVGDSHPCCTSVALPYPLAGAGVAPIASFVDGNPLSSDWLLDLEVPGDRIVLWSGTLSDELFGDEPRTWMRPGQEAFRSFCDAAAPTLVARGRRIAFRPHARHVLSDVQGCLNFVMARDGQPFDLALGPSDLLTPDMFRHASEHLERAFEALGARAAMILLHDVTLPDRAEGGLSPVPLGRGSLPRQDVVRLLAAHVPPRTPVVLLPSALEEQLRWLADD